MYCVFFYPEDTCTNWYYHKTKTDFITRQRHPSWITSSRFEQETMRTFKYQGFCNSTSGLYCEFVFGLIFGLDCLKP